MARHPALIPVCTFAVYKPKAPTKMQKRVFDFFKQHEPGVIHKAGIGTVILNCTESLALVEKIFKEIGIELDTQTDGQGGAAFTDEHNHVTIFKGLMHAVAYYLERKDRDNVTVAAGC